MVKTKGRSHKFRTMSAGLGKLATALTVIFVISLVTLVAELFYVLWRRRVFHRRTRNRATVHGAAALADSNSQTSSDTSIFASLYSNSSKELLYFFCLNRKEISRVEPKSAPPNLNSTGSSPEAEMEVIDVFKLQNMYGPSRVLFTIKEEEKEADFDSEKSLCSSAEKGTEKHSKRMSLEDCLKLKFGEEIPPEVMVEVGDDRDRMNLVGESELTPFSTPCESPSYFTPSASPSREVDISGKMKNDTCDEQTASYLKLEV